MTLNGIWGKNLVKDRAVQIETNTETAISENLNAVTLTLSRAAQTFSVFV